MIKKAVLAVCIIIILTAVLTAGCVSGSAPESAAVTIFGSTALIPLAEEGANEFMAHNPGVNVKVNGGGSGTGLSMVADKACDIGASDLYAEDMFSADKAALLTDHKICAVGYAIAVNPDVTVESLTNNQLIGIFTGKITNWKDVGGSDEEIVILNRPSSSGTRAIFKKYVLGGAEEAQGIALAEESSGVIKAALSVNKGAISYLALPYVDNTIKALKYNGVEPTEENIENGKYKLWSYEHMYTNGEAFGKVKAFLDYMAGPDFAPQITKLGYIPISDMKVSE